jgi:nitroimidazol reductase NimA-like FMN-containing flavoprotein (pyridoxamine 5'-phosphate oxidase superfamily)
MEDRTVTTKPEAQVRELDRSDINALLARHHLGRLVYDWSGKIDVRPVHYTFSGGRIYGRTSLGSKFEGLESLPAPVVLQIDEAESLFRWRSVIARGNLQVITPDASPTSEWSTAISALRSLYRSAFTQGDAVPDRSVVFRIEVEDVTGRAMN